MLALLTETVALVFGTTFLGLVAGFCVGSVAVLIANKRAAPEDASPELFAEMENISVEDPQPARRIPDPAPPSELRRRRLLANQPKSGANISS